jgi:predicted nucleotidyltransferase
MLNRNFREFIRLLEDAGVRFLVVGGYAVCVHGFPRYTGDLDIYVAISRENAEKLLKVFADFGFTDLDVTREDFLAEDFVIEIGREPLKIQVLTGIDGVTFDECYRGRTMVKEDGLDIPFIGREELLKNKAASPRAKDKIDLEELRRIKPPENRKG